MNQSQQGGFGSSNIQIGVANYGLGYADVKAIADAVWNENFAKLSTVARDVANSRASEIRDEVIKILAESPPESSMSFNQPEKQIALLEAQKSYAISGDEKLKELLIKAVMGIASEPERSMKSIVLQEALKIMPALNRRQLDLLRIAFAVRYVAFGRVTSLQGLGEVWSMFLPENENEIVPKSGDYRHLDYCGCGRVGIAKVSLVDLIMNSQPGLISAGYLHEELMTSYGVAGLPVGSFIPCLNDASRLQINPPHRHLISAMAGKWSNEQIEVALRLLSQNPLSRQTVTNLVTRWIGKAGELRELWDGAEGIGHLELTSVGIAVAHTYGSTIEHIGDLSMWL